MRRLTLVEYQRTPLVGVSRDEAITLARTVRGLRVEQSVTSTDTLDAVPGSWIGAVRIGDLEIELRPKVAMDRLFFLISFAVDPAAWSHMPIDLRPEDSVVEAIAAAYLKLISRATHRGLLHGYRTEEDAQPTVRGRIRFQDQIQKRFGLVPPVEVRYDDFTPDILENRLLKSALYSLGRLRLRSSALARGLREVMAAFDGVQIVEYRPAEVREPRFTRLNQHYEPAVRLACLILRSLSFELGVGSESASAFLLDMNDVFEAFVHRALMEALCSDPSAFRRGSSGLHLDEASLVSLEPDLSWWIGGCCRFVGDVKYKRLDVAGFKHGDLYQLLAYTTAANLTSGCLVYAASESDPAIHQIRHCGKLLQVAALNLSATPSSLLAEVDQLAGKIRASVNGPNAMQSN